MEVSVVSISFFTFSFDLTIVVGSTRINIIRVITKPKSATNLSLSTTALYINAQQ